MHLERVELTTKSDKKVKHLKAVFTHVNISYLLRYISERLTKIIHHRSQLQYYRSCHKTFKEHFDTVFLDIDFSENPSIPVKFQTLVIAPQSLHLSQSQITVHSGILKNHGEKSYHPYLSDDRKHDQSFVKIVIKEMLKDADIEPGSYIVIESDNCSSQYKSAPHCHNIQELSDKYKIKIICIYSIAGHGKGEVDHVGGLAKVAIRREIVPGAFFADAEDMVVFLQSKFNEKRDAVY